MISFDVTSLFLMVPLYYTIDLVLKRVYDDKDIQTKISRTKMRKLLLLCTKSVHFTFQNEIYQQRDGVAMGSPPGPVLAGVFMVHLERTLMPQLQKFMKPWKRHVDDTITYIKIDSITRVLDILNGFHKNIKFTYELESNGKISFLNVLLMRIGKNLETTVFRKKNNNDMYLHWKLFALVTWKIDTLKTLIKRAYIICLNDKLLQEELYHIEKCFSEINGYPKWILKEIFDSFIISDDKNHNGSDNSLDTNIVVKTVHTLKLPFKCEEGTNLIKSIKTTSRKALSENHDVRIVLTGTKLSSHFNIKDKTNKQHKHDLVCLSSCPSSTCNDCYISEKGRRLSDRELDHSGKVTKSHFLRHSFTANHEAVDIGHFQILNREYNNNTYKRSVSEALFVKQYRPTLNV